MPYVGASAGSNVAGPTSSPPNDWNVVALSRFDALGLVGFNINPHYKEADPLMAAGARRATIVSASNHVSIATPWWALEEGALVRRRERPGHRAGTARIKLFRRGVAPRWYTAGARLPVK